MVRADTLTSEAILASLARGDFYSSTGVTLLDVQSDARELRIEIAPSGDRRYMTEFIGPAGAVLAAVPGVHPRYRFTGREGYVRARVTDSSGRHAWTQPIRIRP